MASATTSPATPHTFCLRHQQPEECATPIGLVCPECRERLRSRPPRGRCHSFWESQPAAYGLNGEPCFVFTLSWSDYCIRSLHPPEAVDESEMPTVLPLQRYRPHA